MVDMASELPETPGFPGCYVCQALAIEPLNAQGSRPVGDIQRWMDAARFAYPQARTSEEVDKALDEAK